MSESSESGTVSRIAAMRARVESLVWAALAHAPVLLIAAALAAAIEAGALWSRTEPAAPPGWLVCFLLGCNALTAALALAMERTLVALIRGSGLATLLKPSGQPWDAPQAVRLAGALLLFVAAFAALAVGLVDQLDRTIVQRRFRVPAVVLATGAASALAALCAATGYRALARMTIARPRAWLAGSAALSVLAAGLALALALPIFARMDWTAPGAFLAVLAGLVGARVLAALVRLPQTGRAVVACALGWVVLAHLPWGYGPVASRARLGFGDAMLFGWQSQYVANRLPVVAIGDDGDLRAYARRPVASGPAIAQHLLLITVDTLRADHVSLFGYDRPTTPNLDRFFGPHVRFSRCYTTVPNTVPAIGSLMTGRYPQQLSWERANRPPARLTYPTGETLAEVLAGAGFTTNMVVFMGYNPFHWPAFRPGFDHYYKDTDTSKDAWKYPKDARMAKFSSKLIGELDAQPGRKFLWLHFDAPHEPYHRHPRHNLGKRPVDRYDGEIQYFDTNFAQVIQAIERATWTRDAMVVLVADHGETFKEEHGDTHHGRTLFEEEVRIPCLMRLPGTHARSLDVTTQISLIDMMPTFLDLLGVTTDVRMAGRSFGAQLRALDGAAQTPWTDRPIVVSRFDPASMTIKGYGLIVGLTKALFSARGIPLVSYDLAADPREQAPRPDVSKQLVREFRRWYRSVR